MRLAGRVSWRQQSSVASVAAALLLFQPTDASADLRGPAARVADQWRAAGAAVARGTPRFLHDEETITVIVPPSPAERECTTVVLLGARGTSFHARIPGEETDADDRSARERSIAGALTLARCGGPPLRRILVTNDAGRGAIEIIVGRSAAELVPLRAILPERTGVAQSPAPEPGDLPALLAPEKRADAAEARARRDGGTVLPRESGRAAVDGNGAAKLDLGPGCHRVEVFAEDARSGRAPRRPKLDLDAELRDENEDRLMARDRTDAPDAHLEACVGESTRASAAFAGAPPNAAIVTTHATWAIPERLPTTWGSEGRARMASVLLARQIVPPRSAAILQVQGASGLTSVPVALEPGGCYLAVVAIVQGTARGIGLRATVGARDAGDDRGTSDSAGVVAFCAEARARALLEVDARGTAIAWGLVVFRMQGGIWEIAR